MKVHTGGEGEGSGRKETKSMKEVEILHKDKQ